MCSISIQYRVNPVQLNLYLAKPNYSEDQIKIKIFKELQCKIKQFTLDVFYNHFSLYPILIV